MPIEPAVSFTCSTTRLITLGLVGGGGAGAGVVTGRFAAAFFPPFRPAAERRAETARFFVAFFPALLRGAALRFAAFFAERLRAPPFFDDFLEERFFFAAMGHSPFQSVGVGEAVT